MYTQMINTLNWRHLKPINSNYNQSDWNKLQQTGCDSTEVVMEIAFRLCKLLHLYQQEGRGENRLMNNSTYLERLIHPLLVRKIGRWKWISSMWEPGCGGMLLLKVIYKWPVWAERAACWVLAGLTESTEFWRDECVFQSGRSVSHSFSTSQLIISLILKTYYCSLFRQHITAVVQCPTLIMDIIMVFDAYSRCVCVPLHPD